MRRAKALALVLLLASVVGLGVAVYVLGPWKFKLPVIIPVNVSVKVFATTASTVFRHLADVTVNMTFGTEKYSVVTTDAWETDPMLSLRVGRTYIVTASWQQASLTKTISIVSGSLCVIQVQVDTDRGLITSIDFWPYW